MILPPPSAEMSVARQQALLTAVPIEQPMPAWPASVQAPADARVEVCVEFVVREDGAVADVVPSDGAGTCASAPESAFIAATVAAVRDWTYFAAALCEFPDGVAVMPDCEGEGVLVKPVAIRQMYAFTFERRNGEARVGARRRGD